MILASTSPRRAQLLRKLDIPFSTAAPTFEEDCENPQFSLLPSHLIPIEFAYRKAASLFEEYSNDIVIGSDTIVSLNGKLIGKPNSKEEALNFLLLLSKQKHIVITGVSILCKNLGIRCSFSEMSEVEFKPINLSVAEKYTSLVDTMDKAGGYAIQEHPELIIHKYEGSYDNIIGLPTKKLLSALKNIKSTFHDVL